MLEIALALFFLTAMEIVLGIDNIVFIAILTGRLPKEQQPLARRIGLSAALVMRILLLLTLGWILTSLTNPIFTLTDIVGLLPSEALVKWIEQHEEVNKVSIRDLILLFGGLFLIAKAVIEIHAKIEGEDHHENKTRKVSFKGVLFQIALLDIVFSLDSVITAVGMAEQIWVMVTAVIIAVVVMLIFAEMVSAFVQRNPTVKMLALSFLILIGVMLVAEGVGSHIDKGYIYFSMAFALVVEMLNLWVRGVSSPPQQAGGEAA